MKSGVIATRVGRASPAAFSHGSGVVACSTRLIGTRSDSLTSASFAQQSREPAAQFRRPIAMLAWHDRLLVANQRSGTITSIDPAAGSVISEVAVGEQLSDLIALPDGKSVLALDEAKGEAIQLSIAAGSPTIAQRIAVGTSPVTACLWPDQTTCSIALLWAHRLAIVEFGDGAHGRLHVSRTIDLPFAPRLQWISPVHRTQLVADSFGGTLALFDLPAGTLRGYRWIDANNIRGIAASADGRDVHISHLMLASDLPTERDRVSGGQLLGNTLRTVNAEHLLYPAEREELIRFPMRSSIGRRSRWASPTEAPAIRGQIIAAQRTAACWWRLVGRRSGRASSASGRAALVHRRRPPADGAGDGFGKAPGLCSEHAG